MTFHEKLAIYETVISTLKSRTDMVNTLAELPKEFQLEGIRFMEFLNEYEQANDISPPPIPMRLDS